MADERTVSTTDVVSYLDNGDPDYIFEIVDKTARENITSINTTLGKKRSIFYCDYFKFNSSDTTKTKQRYQFVGPYHKMTNGAKTFTAANLIAGDVCFSTEIRAYDGTTVLRRGIFALEYNYKSSSKYYSPAAYTYGAVDFDFTDRLPVVTSSDYESVLAVNSSGEWEVNSDFNTRLYDVENVAGTAANDVLDLQDRVGFTESDISTLQSDMSTATGDIEDLKSTTETLDSAVSEIDDLTFNMRYGSPAMYGKVLTYTENDVWEGTDVPKELPAVTSSDNGKVLKVASGAWAKAAETKELPAVTTSDNNKVLKVVTSADNGKVLGVSSGAWSKMDIPREVPQPTSSDNGSVLAVNSSGNYYLEPDVYETLNQAVSDISYLQEDVSDLSSASSSLRDDVDNALSDIGSLQYNIETAQGQITELETLTDGMNYVDTSDAGKVLTVNSSGTWEAAAVPTELPVVTTSDNNKVLKVVSGAWAKAAETKELPSVTTSDNNKVLKVVSGAWAKAAETKELPTVTASDAGNVLTVNSSGAWAKAAVPTELPAVTSSDVSKVLTVNSSGNWIADYVPDELPAVTSSQEGQVLQVNSNGDYVVGSVPASETIIYETGTETNEYLQYDSSTAYNVKKMIINYTGTITSITAGTDIGSITPSSSIPGMDGFFSCNMSFTLDSSKKYCVPCVAYYKSLAVHVIPLISLSGTFSNIKFIFEYRGSRKFL